MLKNTKRSGIAIAIFIAINTFACGGAVDRTQDLGWATLAMAIGGISAFDEFRASVYKEPFAGGVYIVNGDTPIANEKQLREFYDTHVNPGGNGNTLIVMQANGQDAAWDETRKRNLTYCVSTSFASRYDEVKTTMAAAASAWALAADVGFIHLSAQDGNCSARNQNVVFDVRPVNAGGQYLARAFFPNYGRTQRNVLIEDSAFDLNPSGNTTLEGILRHELGHALGFRHEHTRPESGACFEDSAWRPLTPYDSDSVMHYPQCNGTGNWSLTLTDADKTGAARLYGDALGGTPTPSPSPAGETRNYSGHVAQGAENHYGPFIVKAGSIFKAELTGDGDGDLYVRFGDKPGKLFYNCRPYLNDSAETCSLNVPDGQSRAYVMVRGYRASNYSLVVNYDPGVESNGGSDTRETYSGFIPRGGTKVLGPFQTAGASEFMARMTGIGDADLYVRVGAPPTLSVYDCRPYKWYSNEYCAVSTGSGGDVHVIIRGYRDAYYNLILDYTEP